MSKPEYLLTVSSSPHVRVRENTRTIMLDVLISLLPALIFSASFSDSGHFCSVWYPSPHARRLKRFMKSL